MELNSVLVVMPGFLLPYISYGLSKLISIKYQPNTFCVCRAIWVQRAIRVWCVDVPIPAVMYSKDM